MEKVTSELLFELSSGDRMRLLSDIAQSRQKVSRLAELGSVSIQEASRQVNRLCEAGLIRRDSGGRCALTPFGSLVLKLVPALDFVSLNREYFRSHDLSSVPQEFVERIGELSGSVFGETVGTVFRHSEEVLEGAEKHAWFLADHAVFSIGSIARLLRGKDISVSIVVSDVEPAEADHSEEALKQLGNRLEIRLAPKVPVALAMNEKVAGVAFPGMKGKVDYNSGFRGSDRKLWAWCSDVMSFYWERSKRVV